MGKEAKLVRERILESIDNWERLRDLVDELGVEVVNTGRGRRSSDEYRAAIELALGEDFGRVLEALDAPELEKAHVKVLHESLRGKHKIIDALLPLTCSVVPCYVTPGKQWADTPEERVRQGFARRLHENYGYNKQDMVLEFPVKVGSKRAQRVDVAIFERAHRVAASERSQRDVYMLVECKRQDLPKSKYEEAKEQLETYLSACTNARYGILTTGDRTHIVRKVYEKEDGRRSDFKYIPQPDIPSASQEAPPMTVYADRQHHLSAPAVVAALRAPAPHAAPQPVAMTAEQQWAAAWAHLVQEPGHYLKAEARGFEVRGLLSKTRQVSEIAITNESRFPVQNIRGDVTWFDTNRVVAGTVPFATRGVVPPGHKVTFSLAERVLVSTALATDAPHAVLRCLAFEAAQHR